jgi:hypothetical protein
MDKLPFFVILFDRTTVVDLHNFPCGLWCGFLRWCRPRPVSFLLWYESIYTSPAGSAADPGWLSLSSKKYGFGIRDLRYGKNLFRIPDPGVEKAPDSQHCPQEWICWPDQSRYRDNIASGEQKGWNTTQSLGHVIKKSADDKAWMWKHSGLSAFLVFGVEDAGGGGRDPHHQVGQLLIAPQFVLEDTSMLLTSSVIGTRWPSGFLGTPVFRIRDVYHSFCNIIIVV